MLQWTLGYTCLFQFWFSWCVYLEVGFYSFSSLAFIITTDTDIQNSLCILYIIKGKKFWVHKENNYLGLSWSYRVSDLLVIIIDMMQYYLLITAIWNNHILDIELNDFYAFCHWSIRIILPIKSIINYNVKCRKSS